MSKRKGLTIQQYYDQVVLLLDGKFMCTMPWQVADEIASMVRSIARLAEEYAKANAIIAQDALLIRSGAPFSLTNNPKMREQSFNDAQWDPTARKSMPLAGVPSAKEVGAPSLIKHRGRVQ
jgi:hypothetical protein